ncbi:unnamed protein product, partial [Prorocentrum cordatum]
VYDEIYSDAEVFRRVSVLPPSRALPRGIREADAYLFYDGRTRTGDIAPSLVQRLVARADAYRSGMETPGEPAAGAGRDRQGGAAAEAVGGVDTPRSSERGGGPVGLDAPPLPPRARVGAWLVADPSCGFALGAETADPEVQCGTAGIARLGGVNVAVEWVALDALDDYASTGAAQLRRAFGSAAPAAADIGGADGAGVLEKAKALVSRAQRALRSKADDDMWLKEQLSKLDSPELEGLVKEVFSESGSLKVELSDVMTRLAKLGDAGGCPGAFGDSDARVLAARAPFGIRHRDFRASVEAMQESSWETGR